MDAEDIWNNIVNGSMNMHDTDFNQVTFNSILARTRPGLIMNTVFEFILIHSKF